MTDHWSSLDCYLDQTIEWCKNNGVQENEKIFTLAFVTVLWVANKCLEPGSQKEIYTMLGIDCEKNGNDFIIELSGKLGGLDWEDMLELVNFKL